MEELKITKKSALAAYAEASSDGRKMLENLFGKNVLLSDVKDRVKTFEDVLAELGVSPEEFTNQTEGLSKDEIAYRKIKLIAQALNEGWTPDWKDDDQWKYYPWFDLSSGRGLSYYGYVFDCTRSSVGSRLCFRSAALAEYAGKQFRKLYEDYFLIRQ